MRKMFRRVLKAIFNPSSEPPRRPEDDLYHITRAGKVAGINMILDALEKHSELFERNGDTIDAGKLISKKSWSGDLQATLKDIRAAEPDAAPSIAIFSVRCPQNGLYCNRVDNFHAFFRSLGFSNYAESPDGQNLPSGQDWYAHFGGSIFTPGYLNKEIGHFEIAVPLDGLLQKLAIAPELYTETVRKVQAEKAAEKGVSLAQDNGNTPHRPSL